LFLAAPLFLFIFFALFFWGADFFVLSVLSPSANFSAFFAPLDKFLLFDIFLFLPPINRLLAAEIKFPQPQHHMKLFFDFLLLL
jgi:hypothetical protein